MFVIIFLFHAQRLAGHIQVSSVMQTLREMAGSGSHFRMQSVSALRVHQRPTPKTVPAFFEPKLGKALGYSIFSLSSMGVSEGGTLLGC